MSSSKSASPASSSEESAAVRPLSIVVVDDEPDTVLTLLDLLREQGHRVEGYGSGREALKGIAEIDPDVIVSDIAMPAPNGWDVAKEVRRLKGNGPRPLMIAISGRYTKSADRLLAQISGFNYYLTKPCDPQVLIKLIETARSA